MIDIYALYLSFVSYVNTFQGGWFRPASDFTRACNDISMQLWNEWTAKPDSKEVRDNLIYFLKSKNIMVDSAKGAFGTFMPPTDYGRFASARYLTNGKSVVPSPEVEEGKCEGFETDEQLAEDYYDNIQEIGIESIENMKWGAVTKHLTKKPSLSAPKITQINGGFKVAPREISVVVLDYYVKPVDAIFGYTVTPGNPQTGAGDQIIYDVNRSKKLMWPETMRNEFLIALGSRFSSYTRDQFLAQYTAQQKRA